MHHGGRNTAMPVRTGASIKAETHLTGPDLKQSVKSKSGSKRNAKS